ncbi:PQQ-dependent sugar dehydrogenase [Pseudoduganella umbonata]|uniref:Glucose/arabinose dehydrogenase n=1 Tax=Pseudoduganella umbonata TaxID=864828 RepID=A0A4P8HP41_9BURK|nr:PQQ-dependent sugar dehydrogenase [Pseudoduganella umbonata]MBB3220999.1 glucose/arabinose dehydrogenase [Pseudoduganella umbonata]QCP10210.1 PQQ-dependent sugar dehydrogenase [Pseudoduganella umbonata]
MTRRPIRPLPAASAIAAAFLAFAVAIPAAVAQNTPLADPIPGTLPASAVAIGVRPLLANLTSPVAGAVAPGEPNQLYIVDQVGRILKAPVRGFATKGVSKLFLDVSSRLVPLNMYDERGLLGLAFHPDYASNGRFYLFTSEPVQGQADFSTLPAGTAPVNHSVVSEWRVANPGSANPVVDPASVRVLMRIDKPQGNHNGGALAFGPDRMLYISLGDGGAGDDQGTGHAPEGNAQSLAPGNVLGKILRIDPLGSNAANGAYGIPADNPFVNRDGADEIFAYGLRNPFRMGFDAEGTLWAGDVGQGAIEEVNHIVSGGNYGWRVKEGSFLFDANGTSGGFVYQASPGAPAGLIDPVAEYDHADGAGQPTLRRAVIGGYVYDGKAIPQLRGQYVFADYVGDDGTGKLLTLGVRNQVEQLLAPPRDPLGIPVLGMAQDAAGEIYVLGNADGSTRGNAGVVLKLVPRR